MLLDLSILLSIYFSVYVVNLSLILLISV